MGRFRVNIARYNIGLYLVALHTCTRRGTGDWIQHPEKFAGLIAVAQLSKSNDCPRGSMSILAAIFTDARHIALNIAGVALCFFKRRFEEENQSLGTAHQLLIYSLHGARRTTRFGSAAHN